MTEKKPGKYMQFYKDCIINKRLKDFGLCSSLGGDLLELFKPTEEDEDELANEGLSILYWASGVSSNYKYDNKRWFEFTPLRQTIVLFMAALNDEL